ncbi:hypothetical protein FNI26_24395 [Salmonella enterica subsp. diarizonae]|nr:hypothetical protein [Salmonella enterica subsp. diarizonae]EBR3878019.1 hypothetical protein [Salmonella enterica subsp. arizonae]EHG2952314.1 hypothetical protein [Salmonella enterica subsp. diarizonae serovar 53:r:z35]ELV5048778.1 hypothetical protein [Salmonella enterica]HCS9548841.1 hypothetical protein [Salmonella enterica subsp. diarizonae serovar 61:r:z53]
MARGTKKTDAGEATNEPGVTLPENTASSDTGSDVVLPEITGSADLSMTDTAVTETRGADDVMVQPVRYFTDSATGGGRTPSDEPFSVNRRRAAELSAGGLAREVKPQPDNKMRPDPQTKE